MAGIQGATKVTSRAHVTDYLIRDMSVLHEVSITVERIYLDDSGAFASDTQTVERSGPAKNDALDPGMRDKLHERFKGRFDFIP